MKGINVLSIFDGMSCGQIALERAGIKVNKYFASEIDKYAIKITQKNYPNTIQLGDVTKWKEWNLPKIDLLIGGSPCQGFSFAGKQLNFDDPRSALFFEFANALNYFKPRYFMMENVKMKKEYQDVINNILEREPIKINSKLFSAQSRERLYWTNVNVGSFPEINTEVIADVIEETPTGKKQNKIIMTKSNFKVKVRKNFIKKKELSLYLREKRATSKKTIREISKYCDEPITKVEHWFRLDSSFSIPPPESWSSLKKILNLCDNYDSQINEFEIKNNNFDMAKRIYHINGKHPTLTTLTGGGQRKTITNGKDMFYLNPIHCERLQTVPDNYTEGVSNTQRYKMLGNGWTVDVIVHILKNIKEK